MVTFLLYIHKDTGYLKVVPDTNKGRGKWKQKISILSFRLKAARWDLLKNKLVWF